MPDAAGAAFLIRVSAATRCGKARVPSDEGGAHGRCATPKQRRKAVVVRLAYYMYFSIIRYITPSALTQSVLRTDRLAAPDWSV